MAAGTSRAPAVKRSGQSYTQNYATPSRTVLSYTTDPESDAYTGDLGGVATVSSPAALAKVADLNALRVAYENLRASHDNLLQVVTALIDDLQTSGIVQ